MSDSKIPNELILWHEFDGPGDVSINVIGKICDMYSERNHIRIKPVVKNIYEITRFLKRRNGNGNNDRNGVSEFPHMAFLPSDLVMYAYNGRFSVVPEQLYQGRIDENALSTMIYEGKQFGLPVLGGNHLLLYYNKDIFPSGISDWTELYKTVGELRSRSIIPISLDLYQMYWILPILSAFGAWPVEGIDPKNIKFDSLKEAFCFIDKMLDEGILGNCEASIEMLDKFFDGKIGAIIAGEWSYKYIMENMGNKAGICGIPDIAGKKCTVTSSTLGLMYMGSSLETEFKDYLLGFGEFMLSEECQELWMQEVDRIPLIKEVNKKLVQDALGGKKVVLEQLYESHPLKVSSTSEELWSTLELGKELFWYRSYEIDEAMDKMKERIMRHYTMDK
jgi:arabinogalactan oligomer/maltooligosaccharide transport system substrate-binding protein